MEKKKNTQLIIIAVLSFALLFMSVGFATYAQNLQINGTVNFAQSKWSVHFDETEANYVVTSGSKTATKTLGKYAITFSVNLDKPGDFYEFTVPVINDGTFNATLSKITMTESPADKAYVDFAVWYNNTKYTATTTSITNPSLPYTSGSNTASVKVRVEYIAPDDSDDLPTSGPETVSFTVMLDYDQA